MKDGGSESSKSRLIRESVINPDCGCFFVPRHRLQKDTGKSDSVLAWQRILKVFESNRMIGNVLELKAGLSTGDILGFKVLVRVTKEAISFFYTGIVETPKKPERCIRAIVAEE